MELLMEAGARKKVRDVFNVLYSALPNSSLFVSCKQGARGRMFAFAQTLSSLVGRD
jgi:hypothetical protein